MDRNKSAYNSLKKAILENEYPNGTPLREQDLAEHLHVSRTPIREALRQLEKEGLVVNYPARGCFVTSITPYDVEEIYELRTMLELFALEKSFNRITAADLDSIESKFALSNDAFDFEAYHDADRSLHRLFFDRCGNKRAVRFMEMLNAQVERIRHFSDIYTPRTNEERLTEHLEIIRCIREKDLEATKNALSTHLRHVADAAIETCRMCNTNS